MEDLRRILAARESFYSKADVAFDTTGKALAEAFAELRSSARAGLEAAQTHSGSQAPAKRGSGSRDNELQGRAQRTGNGLRSTKVR
jgi:hypothetical protein